jgi:hypothetical protein
MRHFAHSKNSNMALLLYRLEAYHQTSQGSLYVANLTESRKNFMSKTSRDEKTSAQRKEARQRARQRQKQVRSAIFVVLVVGVLGLAGYLLKEAFFKPAPPPIAGNVIDIAADMGGFDKPEIRVKVSEAVTIRLTSLDTSAHTDGGGKHQWAVEELAWTLSPPKGNQLRNVHPGSAGYVHLLLRHLLWRKANPSMQGKLIVEA